MNPLVALLVVLFALPSTAQAQATLVPPEREGTGLITLTGDLAIIDSDATYASSVYGGGLSLQIVGRPAGWPVMVGINGGIVSFGSTQMNGPIVGRANSEGWSIGTTRVTRSIEWRHVSLVTRFQPYWGFFRPFVELAFGMVALWHTGTLEDALGETIGSEDEQLGLAALGGVTLGIDWRVHTTGSTPCGTNSILVTTGLKRWYTTAMERPGYFIEDDVIARHPVSAALAAWMPFVGVTVSIDTRPSAQRESAQTIDRCGMVEPVR